MTFSAQSSTVPSGIRSTAWTRRLGPTAPVALVPLAAFLAGGYYESTYSLLAAVVWLGIAIVSSLRPLPRPSAATWLLLGLTGWTLLSALWGQPGAALRTAPLVALYAGVLLVAEWSGGLRQLDALRVAVVLVALAGLVARAADVAPTGGGPHSERLAWPVTYANGLGLLAVYGVLLCAGLPRAAPAAAAVCGAAAYLTFSRSALLVGAGAALLLVALRPAAARGIAGAALGVAAVAALDATGGTAGPTLVPAVALAAATAHLLPIPSNNVLFGAARKVLVVGALLVAVAGAAFAQPLAARFAAPAPDERNAHRLLDVSGHGRTRLWRIAWDEGSSHPVLGGGAGTWAREATARIGLDAPANAHSLYLETFAELGLVGLALLLAALALARAREPAALALLAAFVVHASVDWDWQLPAVTIPALLAAGAGLRAARRPAPFALAPLALAIGLAAGLHGIGAALLESGGDQHLAARLLPWDARPWVALGETARACATDRRDPVIARLRPPNGGCESGR